MSDLAILESSAPANHMASRACRVAFGPDTGWGSWQWVGAAMCETLSARFDTFTFRAGEGVRADAVVFVKFLPDPETLTELAHTAAVIFCPVDVYGSAREIYLDRPRLRLCDRIIVHCHRLQNLFAPFARVEYLDHHVRFVAEPKIARQPGGMVLWTGSCSNLPPLVEWVNRHQLPGPLCVLTDVPAETARPLAVDYGFRSRQRVSVERWSAARHTELLSQAWLALDIKGADFRQRNKPPAKALDFIASGLPLAMNADSSSAEHLDRLGFQLAIPEDVGHWTSAAYLHETIRCGAALRELLSKERVAFRLARIIEQTLSEKQAESRVSHPALSGESR